MGITNMGVYIYIMDIYIIWIYLYNMDIYIIWIYIYSMDIYIYLHIYILKLCILYIHMSIYICVQSTSGSEVCQLFRGHFWLKSSDDSHPKAMPVVDAPLAFRQEWK